ncbi:MAG: MFS transporter [Candidatus Dormiibacterota bacterium]
MSGRSDDVRSRDERVGRVRWLMVGLAFAGIGINYIDRSNLGVAVPFIDKDLHLSTATTGIALSAFFFTYALFQLVSGYVVDRIGARIVYAFGAIWWSVFTASTALANSFASLIGFRLALGVGEAGGYPSCAKVVAEWFPLRERGIATSIYDNGQRFGTALATPLVVFLIAQWGWRSSFAVSGLLGLVWVAFWIVLYRSPGKHPWVKQPELDYIAQGARSPEREQAAVERSGIRWIDLFRYRTIWGMMIGFFCVNFVIYFFITWFPDYLVTARHFDLLKLGYFGSIPAVVAIFGGWFGGFVADRLVRSGMSITKARKICLVAGLLCSSVIAVAVIVPSAVLALVLLSVCFACTTFTAASVWSLPADVAPTARHVSSIGGIQNCASNIAGIVSPSYTGFVVAATNGSFVIPLVTAGGLAIVGALAYLFIVGKVEPLPWRQQEAAA